MNFLSRYIGSFFKKIVSKKILFFSNMHVFVDIVRESVNFKDIKNKLELHLS